MQRYLINTSTEDRAAMFEYFKWLADLSALDCKILANYAYSCEIPPGTTVCLEGAREDSMYLLISGSVSILKESGNGEPVEIGLIGAGRTFGEMALFDGGPRSASIKAKEKLSALVLSREKLAELVANKPATAARFIWKLAIILTQNLRRTSGKLVELI